MRFFKGQLTIRGLVIGCIGCAAITIASVYTALKMGALPWPILFAAIISLSFLKLFGRTNLNEINVTHTIMSAGAMVAGGLAFTIPSIWMLGYASDVSWWQIVIIALSGVVLGLIATLFLRRHFIEEAELEYPLGEAAAQTIIAGDAGGQVGKKLFGSMGFAGIYTALRDWFGVIPAMLFGNVQIPGIAFGIYNSPMLLAIGFIVGIGAVIVWFVGALIGNFGIITGGSFFGWWDVETGRSITSSLGMGIMMGCGVGVILKILGSAALNFGKRMKQQSAASTPRATGASLTTQWTPRQFRIITSCSAFAIAAVALVLCFALELGPLPSLIIVVFAWFTTAMSAQSVGQTSIDPMEIFGLIVLLIVAALSSISQVQLFFVAAVIAVTCGLAGDVMNDFKTGHILGTNPFVQWVGQAIGAVLGAALAVIVLSVLLQAYGPSAFGPGGSFIATQATIVATMVAGIPSLPAFLIGFALGCLLYFVGFPSMMLGLGVYLPFYLSFTAFLGALVKLLYDYIGKRRAKGQSEERVAELSRKHEETGIVVSSGLLGGESIIGVLIALGSIILFVSG